MLQQKDNNDDDENDDPMLLQDNVSVMSSNTTRMDQPTNGLPQHQSIIPGEKPGHHKCHERSRVGTTVENTLNLENITKRPTDLSSLLEKNRRIAVKQSTREPTRRVDKNYITTANKTKKEDRKRAKGTVAVVDAKSIVGSRCVANNCWFRCCSLYVQSNFLDSFSPNLLLCCILYRPKHWKPLGPSAVGSRGLPSTKTRKSQLAAELAKATTRTNTSLFMPPPFGRVMAPEKKLSGAAAGGEVAISSGASSSGTGGGVASAAPPPPDQYGMNDEVDLRSITLVGLDRRRTLSTPKAARTGRQTTAAQVMT